MNGFVDANLSGDVNNRRSTIRYIFNAGSAAVSWCNKKQTTVALSTYEAEYVTTTMATQEWFTQEMVSDFNYPVPFYCNNENAIKLAKNLVFHAHTKHIEIHYHFLREKVLTQDIDLVKI